MHDDIHSGKTYKIRASPTFLFLLTISLVGVLTVGGWAVSKAYKNQTIKIAQTQDQLAYQVAVQQYQAGDYAQALETFERLRSSPHGVTASHARKMAVNTFRILGQTAQRHSDLASAEYHFGKAVSIAVPPEDVQARAELVAVQEARGTQEDVPDQAEEQGPLNGVTSEPPAPAEPSGARGLSPENPLASVLAAPSPATANDFAHANKTAGREAEKFYQRGEAAKARGDINAAIGFWNDAVAAGPGSLAAIRAQERIAQRSLPSSSRGNPLASILGKPSPVPVPPNANNAAGREADALYRQGEAAWSRGDQSNALRLWTAAVAAGPGSPASLRAQARITQHNNANDPLGGM